MTTDQPTAELLRRRLMAFGVPATDAALIASSGRIHHRWGPKRRDIEYALVSQRLRGLARAEHAASVFHNFRRCYHVDTTRLAMQARSAA